MAQPNYIRVKLKFRDTVKVSKLDRRVDTSLCSMANVRKLIFQTFPKVQEMVQSSSKTTGAAAVLLEVKCQDSDGDYVTLESDEDLELALESRSEESDLKFEIRTIQTRRSISVTSPPTLNRGRRVMSEGPRGSSFGRYGNDNGTGIKQSRPIASQMCRAFERGHCRYGPTCRFSHESSDRTSSVSSSHGGGNSGETPNFQETTNSLPFRNFKEVDYWLMNQLKLAAGENIEQLSGEKGIHMLSKVVEQRCLPTETITLLVKVLAKDEIRISMLRQQTNKIYGVLLGSPFLLQLHAHVASHLGIRTPKPQDVRPYLLLIEELQSRTADGWKEVPLDAIRSVVSRLEENGIAKEELMAIVCRLDDHREKLQRLLAIAPPDKCLQGAKFRQMPIVASKEELVNFQARKDLPVNRIGMQYSRVSDYLETHFQLLREDCIDPLRQGIKVYRSNCRDTNNRAKPSSSTQELRIYSRVHLTGVRCGDNGVEYVVKFHLPARENQQWESSKKLMYGALLCISSDGFQSFFWGVVARRDVKDLAKGLVAIRIIGESEGNVAKGLQSGETSAQVYVMVESTAAYFEAYYHVLKSLQREEMGDIPFTPYLLHLEPKVRPPAYLLRRKGGDEYDFGSVFPDIQQKLGRSSIRVMQSEWPHGWAASLDKAQQEALKQGLTKELAIIQGPPGTGKTFLGLLLVRILLANLKRSPGPSLNRAGRGRTEQDVLVNDEQESDITGPILVICYTNHALDQFLEGIYRNGETNLIRIGGRGKSEILKERNLQSLLQKQRMDHEVDGSHRRFFGQGRSEKDSMETQIHKCIDVMGLKFVTYKLLEGVATSEQMESLFSIGRPDDQLSKNIVKVWLSEAPFLDPHLAHRYLRSNEMQFLEENIESDSGFEEAKQPLRGQMKLLPTSESDENIEWKQVTPTRRRGRMGAAPVARDVPLPVDHLEFMDEENEGENGWGLDDADEGVHPLLPEMGAAPVARDVPSPADPLEFMDEENEGENGWGLDDANEGVHPLLPEPEQIPLQDFIDMPNVWDMNLLQRRRLHEYWLEEIRMNCRRRLSELTQEYERACKYVTEVENEIQLSLLRKCKVVGMTTTAAARYHDVLKSLRPNVVIVEEAAEVLEGHILACLNPSVKHLILIGDHLQLRPSVAVYRLSTEHKLDVSMFERLVRSGVEHVTLQEQRRMRPNISKLVRSLYPRSRDHECVTQYEAVTGVTQNVFFFDHKAEEINSRGDAGSKVNPTEAKIVVELCLYLLNQGCYKAEHITILSMYTGQLQEIKNLLREKSKRRLTVRAIGQSSQDPGADETDLLPRVSSVDDYQGEESDIIILSLVRSNTLVTNDGVGKIGFLNIPNRICVALTRARKGLFIFGNASLLAERSTLWKDVINNLQDDGALGPQLELYCQNHRDTITKISKVEDFKQVEDGGCSLACEYQLECGHVCPRRCHPGSHAFVVCPKPCLRQYDECVHVCNLRCHGREDCPPCKVLVTKQLLNCEHRQSVECSQVVTAEIQCRSACSTGLECGHPCRALCGRICTRNCPEKVVKMLPCGHSATMPCHQSPESFSCNKSCKALLPDCQHVCEGTCGECKRGTAHILCRQKCGRPLPCGHLCEAGCSVSCPPCRKRCQKRCFHSRCSEPCGSLCTPCRERCAWQCKHHQCDKLCHEICTRPRCDFPCPKLIKKCRHPCIGLCGEPCPTKCRLCHPQTLDVITQMTLEENEESDRFVQLQDCGHIFEVSGLDTWMDASESLQRSDGSVAIKLRECPECRTPIWRTHRYSNVVKSKHSQVEEVKKKMNGYELTRRGNLELAKRDHIEALSFFIQALKQNPGLMDAHFGTGCVLVAKAEYGQAITHLSFIVARSSFAPALAKLIAHTDDDGRGHAVAYVEKFFGRSSSRAGDALAIQAILQWTSALTRTRKFTDAIELCNAVLAVVPEHRQAAEVKTKAQKGEVQMVVQAMKSDVGERGHWYTCPNGHYYTIGECGGANQVSKCPDCNAQVGGASHRLLEGNRHSNIDGSSRSAWS